MTERPSPFSPQLDHGRLSDEYWHGNITENNSPFTLYPDYNGETIRFARNQATDALKGRKIETAEPMAVFEQGSFFDASRYNPGTIIRIDQDSLIISLAEHNVLFQHIFWAVICESKDKNPNLSRLLLGFNEYTLDGKTQINFDRKPEPFPGSFTVGDVWKDEFSYDQTMRELRKAKKLEIITLGKTKKKPQTKKLPQLDLPWFRRPTVYPI